ncbi:hypothetical protein Q3O43_20035 [Rhodococcus aetherivorans]|uniref:DUF6907 domain-containing protein n=1 Tax=Rhodococcus aetherivorans TaxID=191292 RepID=UPI0026EE6692|nr:hypothetical protein [Rhodococcus aetherivorans]WKW97311.1 hypothetical protein Q3O43_20035 [Rhodococcus aetherivorans]
MLNEPIDLASAPFPPLCPAWCTHQGHDWDSLEDDGTASRHHDGPRWLSVQPAAGLPVGLMIGGMDRADGKVEVDIQLDATSCNLTAAQARQLAGNLLAAADELERITGD